VPTGIAQVIHSETSSIMTLTRIAWIGAAEKDALQGLQRQIHLMPLSQYAGTKPPPPSPVLAFPAWDAERAQSPDFISYLNFILQFCPVHSSEQDMMARFARIGIGPGRPFDSGALDRETRDAIAAGVAEGRKRIDTGGAARISSAGMFGTRGELGFAKAVFFYSVPRFFPGFDLHCSADSAPRTVRRVFGHTGCTAV
jgi:hypothetical protein